MYYIIYGTLYFFSLLPMPVLYLFSDLVYFIIYHIIGYRKQVVFGNLQQAFPDKPKKEIVQIAKKFYHNFADTFLETIKLLSANEKFITKRFTGDFSVFDYLYQNNRKCQIHSAHNFNWEYANLACALNMKQTLLSVYMPINNKIVDRLFRKIRLKTGAVLLPATQMKSAMLPYRDILYSLALVADQSPGNPQNAYWFNFFGKPAPFVKTPESAARRGNIAIVFAWIYKIKRGYYKITFSLASENPADAPPVELTKKYVSFLEQVIRDHPDTWLWSHRRWKWDWKEEYGEIHHQNNHAGAIR